MNQERIERGIKLLEILKMHGYTIEDLIDVYEMLGTSFSEAIAEMEAEAKAKEELELKVAKIFKKIGIARGHKGYDYLKYAIILAYNDEHLLKSVTKKLYPMIAEEYGKSVNSVERSMRYAIANSTELKSKEVMSKYFDSSTLAHPEKLCTSRFVKIICGYLHDDSKSNPKEH